MKKAAMVASVPGAEEIQAQGTIKAKQKGNTKRPWVSIFRGPRTGA
jgi:hypothetical protein